MRRLISVNKHGLLIHFLFVSWFLFVMLMLVIACHCSAKVQIHKRGGCLLRECDDEKGWQVTGYLLGTGAEWWRHKRCSHCNNQITTRTSACPKQPQTGRTLHWLSSCNWQEPTTSISTHISTTSSSPSVLDFADHISGSSLSTSYFQPYPIHSSSIPQILLSLAT